MNVIKKPRAIFFDLDNTLYPYDPCHEAGLAAAQKKAESALGIKSETFLSLYDAARKEVKASLKGTACSHSRLFYFQRLIEKVGLRSQVLATLDLEQTYWGAYLGAAELFSGAKEFLEELKTLQIPLVLVTDLTAHIQFRKLIYLQLDELFDFVVTSEEAGFDKPNPKIFEVALEKIGVGEGDIWMIGEDLKKDIHGSRDAIKAVTFQKIHAGVERGSGDKRADREFSEFSELMEVVQELRGNEAKKSA